MPVLPQHLDAVERGACCEACPLHGCGAGPIVPRIVSASDVLIIEESPSQGDVDTGRPLSGNSGVLVSDALVEGGVPSARTSVTSVTLCRPPGGHLADYAMELRRKAKARGEEAVLPEACCAPRLERDLHDSGAKVVLTLGSESLRAAARLLHLPHGAAKSAPGTPRVAALKRQHGAPVLLPREALGRPLVLLGTFHPRFVFAGNSTYLPVLRQDILRAAKLACRAREAGESGESLLDWREPRGFLEPSADVCVNVLDSIWASGQLVTVDVETDGIHTHSCGLRCVGLGVTLEPGNLDSEVIIVVPWRRMNGNPWWTPAEQVRVGRALSRMDQAPLSGHNLAFDTAVLLRHGFLQRRGKHHVDTLTLFHHTDLSELPHDLGFVASRYFDAPHWKDDADAKSVDGVDDYWLHKYCLYRGTPIVMADGTTETIENLIQTRSTAKVLALKNGQIVSRQIFGWHKQRVKGQAWINIQIARQRNSARGLVCTPEHKILVHRNNEGDARWVQACDVRVGDFLYTPERELDPDARKAILGTLLGDSSLTFSPVYRGREAEAPGAGISCVHVAKSNLAQTKRALLPDLFTHQKNISGGQVVISGRSGTSSPALRITSKQHRVLGELYPLFYDSSGSRRLRIEVLNALGAIGLAWWFMDDGCVQKGGRRKQNTGARGGALFDPDGAVFATQRYPTEDVEVAAAWFTDRFGKTYVCGDGTLRLTYKAAAEFAREVAPFVFPAQRYKLPRGSWPEFDSGRSIVKAFSDTPITAQVTKVQTFTPEESRANVRYCIDVEDAHNFFTPWGLVHNCMVDVAAEMRLVPKLLEAVRTCGTTQSFLVDTRLSPIARDMGALGLHIDEGVRHRFFETLEVAGHERLELIQKLVGRSDFNPNSFRQVARYLFEEKGLSPPLSTTGEEWADFLEGELQQDSDAVLDKAATNEPALLRLLDLGVDKQLEAFIEALLSYRGVRKCQSTYLGLKRDDAGQVQDVFRQRGVMRTESHGPELEKLSILHSAWRVTGTVSGRWSSQPNTQNWPERVVYSLEEYRATKGSRGILNTRAQVTAPPGYVLVGADYKAVELRLYAVQSQDAMLLRALNEDMDPHSLNYATMQARDSREIERWYQRVLSSEPKVKKYLRNIAKRLGFLIIYGGEREKLFTTMSADRNPDGTRSFPDLKPADVNRWWDNWHRTHPETKRWQQRVVREFARDGYVAAMLDGRKRFCAGGIDANAACNHTIQSSAAAITNRALIALAEKCPYQGWGPLAGPILQVHDFLCLQVPVARQAEAEALLEECMPYTLSNGFRFDIERKSGHAWSEV